MTNREAAEILKRIDRHDDWKPKLMPFEIEARDMAIKALEQQESERWIPVSERLPECTMTVYVSARHVESTSDFVTEMKYDAYDERWKWGNGKYISDKYTVRAWHRKQYPKPYSEKNRKKGEY